MVTGLGLGIAASGHKFAAAVGASWANWTTSNVGSIATPSAGDNLQARTAEIFNCGDDDNVYVVFSNNASRNDFYIYRYSRSGTTLTYESRSGLFTSTANSARFNRSIVIDLPDFNKAIMLQDRSFLVVMTQNTSTKAVTFGSEQTSLNTAGFGTEPAYVVNPDDNTEFAGINSSGDVTFCSFNNSTDVVTLDSTDSLGTAVEYTIGVFDSSGTKKVAVTVWDGTNLKVYTYNFDGTGKTTTDLGTSFSGFSQSSFNSTSVSDPTLLIVNDNNTNVDDVVGLYWDGSSWDNGTPTSWTPPTGTSVNNVRAIRVFEPLREDGYKAVVLHMDTSGSTPRANYIGIFYVNPSNGSVTQIDDWFNIAGGEYSLGNVLLDACVTSNGSHLYAITQYASNSYVGIRAISKE